MRTARALLLPLCWLPLAACLAIPVPEQRLAHGRGALQRADLSFLRPGDTTREEVLLRLGEPDLSLRSGAQLLYSWGGVAGIAVVAFGAGIAPAGGVGTIPRHHLVALEFAADGRLTRFTALASTYSLEQLARDAGIGTPPLRVVVDPSPGLWANLDAAPPGKPLARVRLGGFLDAREAPFLGTRLGAVGCPPFGKVEVHASRPVDQIVRAAVGRALTKAGFLLVESGEDCRLTGVVHQFEDPGNSAPRARLMVTLEVDPQRGAAPAPRQYERTLWLSSIWHSPPAELDPGSAYTGMFAALLEHLQRQVASDPELRGLLTASPGVAERPGG